MKSEAVMRRVRQKQKSQRYPKGLQKKLKKKREREREKIQNTFPRKNKANTTI